MCTWTLRRRGSPPRQAAACDVVGEFARCRRVAGDPRQHGRLGHDALGRYSAASGGPGGGGVVLGVARRLLREFPQILQEELCGRAHMLRCRRAGSEDGVVFFSLHFERASPLEAKKRLIDSVWMHSKANPQCLCIALGGITWSTVIATGSR